MDFSHAFISHTIRSTSDGEEKEGEVSDEHVDEECGTKHLLLLHDCVRSKKI